MRSSVSALALLLLAGCDRTVVTPAGTTLVEVKTPEQGTSMMHVGQVKGPLTPFETTLRFRGPGVASGAGFKIAFEHGPAELVVDRDAGGSIPRAAEGIRNLRISVVDNTRFTMSATCSSYVASTETAAYVLAMHMNCTVTLTRGKDEPIATNLDILADGTVRSTRGLEWEIEIR